LIGNFMIGHGFPEDRAARDATSRSWTRQPFTLHHANTSDRLQPCLIMNPMIGAARTPGSMPATKYGLTMRSITNT
jgi:hypothetical protein